MEPTKWEFSTVAVEASTKFIEPVTGDQPVKIVSAEVVGNKYVIGLVHPNGAKSQQRYTLYKDPVNRMLPNNTARTMHALGCAVFGPDCADMPIVPAPVDIIGAVVCARVVANVSEAKETTETVPLFDDDFNPVLDENGIQKTETKVKVLPARTWYNVYEYFPATDVNLVELESEKPEQYRIDTSGAEL